MSNFNMRVCPPTGDPFLLFWVAVSGIRVIGIHACGSQKVGWVVV